MKPEISIVIPALDEEERLGNSIRGILTYLKDNRIDAELIVVDDGSKDLTADVATQTITEFGWKRSKVIRYETNRGKGFAVRTGLRAATAEVALFSDADLSTPISEMPKLIDPIKRGEADVVFGSRALDRNLIGTHQPWRREQGGKVFNLVVRMMTRLPFWDTQCGFKAFNMVKFRPMLEVMKIDRFGFDVEFLCVAHLHGLRLDESAVRWNDDPRSKVSVLRDSLRMVDEVRQIRRNVRAGLYDLSAESKAAPSAAPTVKAKAAGAAR